MRSTIVIYIGFTATAQVLQHTESHTLPRQHQGLVFILRALKAEPNWQQVQWIQKRGPSCFVWNDDLWQESLKILFRGYSIEIICQSKLLIFSRMFFNNKNMVIGFSLLISFFSLFFLIEGKRRNRRRGGRKDKKRRKIELVIMTEKRWKC